MSSDSSGHAVPQTKVKLQIKMEKLGPKRSAFQVIIIRLDYSLIITQISNNNCIKIGSQKTIALASLLNLSITSNFRDPDGTNNKQAISHGLVFFMFKPLGF